AATLGSERARLHRGEITDQATLERAMREHRVEGVVHLAAVLQFDPCELIRTILSETLPEPTIMDEWKVTANEMTILLQENPSLRGMLFGYVAELKLRELISAFPGVGLMKKFDDHDRKKKGDLHIIYHHRAF
ncbi:MAG: hypothetical protein HC790_04720, partial [Acaryochloridaceae cyanobacterium CSU_3_4]|nr:hypothetical protein [Acaryochloridaceae cyanobacterium CSU_3_4]